MIEADFFDMSAAILPWARSNGYVKTVVIRAVQEAAPIDASIDGLESLVKLWNRVS